MACPAVIPPFNSNAIMPPKSDKLPANQIALIKQWIDGGAPENSGSKVVLKKPKFTKSKSSRFSIFLIKLQLDLILVLLKLESFN